MSINAQINAELLTWANQILRPWQQEAFRRLLSKAELTEIDKAEIFQRALADYGFKQPSGPIADLSLTATDLPPTVGVGESIHLVSLQDARQINALKPGQRISFGNHLTVVFGDNGSGKSGYARLMKAACAAKAVEDLLPEVFASSAPNAPPTAKYIHDQPPAANFPVPSSTQMSADL